MIREIAFPLRATANDYDRASIGRFVSKLNVSDGGCWIWTACTNRRGYGECLWQGRIRWSAHRLAYTLAFEDIPSGMVVCHKCDVPLCVNPSHLFVGTMKDNQRDMVAKGRCWHSKKTHCPSGHPYDGDNLYIHPGGVGRSCRRCQRVHQKRYKDRLRKERRSA